MPNSPLAISVPRCSPVAVPLLLALVALPAPFPVNAQTLVDQVDIINGYVDVRAGTLGTFGLLIAAGVF